MTVKVAVVLLGFASGILFVLVTLVRQNVEVGGLFFIVLTMVVASFAFAAMAWNDGPIVVISSL